MKTLTLKNKYLTFNFSNSQEAIADVKDYIRKYECPELKLNLEKINLLDAAKIVAMTSMFHNKKYPQGKLICKTQEAIKKLLTESTAKNMEFVI